MTEFINTYSDYIIGILFLAIFNLISFLVFVFEKDYRESRQDFEEMKNSDTQKRSEMYRRIWNKTND